MPFALSEKEASFPSSDKAKTGREGLLFEITLRNLVALSLCQAVSSIVNDMDHP